MSIPNATSLELPNDKMKLYESILNKCIKQIKLEHNNGNTSTRFKIPEIIIEIPTYSVKNCAFYIIEKLLCKHYRANLKDPCYIEIDWSKKSHNDENTKIMNKIKALYPRASIEFIYKK